MWTRIGSGVAVAACAGLMAGPVSAAYIDVDFENETVGDQPDSASYVSAPAGSGTRVVVVDDASTPANPLGSAGNKSLLLEKSVGNGTAIAGFIGAAGGLTKGTLTLDFAAHGFDPAQQGPVYPDIQVGPSTNNANVTTKAIFLTHSGASFRYQANGSVWVDFDQSLTTDVNHTLTIQFDTVTDTWSAELDGTSLTSGGGATSTFAMNVAVDNIRSVTFAAGYSTNENTRFFVDNIVMAVPEPASVGLLAAGLVGFGLRRRRD